jgi:hypothetical protein
MRARSLGANSVEMTVNTVDISTPAPSPWRPRKTMSWVMSWARPHRADVRTKKAAPPSRNQRRP